jgi:hypothetical protein
MHLEFWRASTPSDMGLTDCCFCGEQFHVFSVVTVAFDRPQGWMHGLMCPSCLRDLGLYTPGGFPTLAELYAAIRRYPEPIWSSDEQADAELDSLGFDAPDFWRVELS